VYGADVEPDMVRHLQARARSEGLGNLVAVEAARDDPRLPVPVDVAVVVNTYHHIGDRAAYFGRLRERLAAHGRVAILDFRPDAPMGPPPRHRIPAGVVEQEMKRAGYELAAEHRFLPHQYFLVFAPAPR
jgi:SAM-dependent methyltransferase